MNSINVLHVNQPLINRDVNEPVTDSGDNPGGPSVSCADETTRDRSHGCVSDGSCSHE